jgi:1,4-dihydroxy-2-naphthoate octaprenyltransferase
MATTAINNYLDFKRASRKYGYGYERHNAIVRDNLREGHVLAVIIILFSAATILGIILFINTNLLVLFLGAVSFTIGVLYSFGPFPISRTPFGEIFSGGVMGFLITFIAMYIHVVDRGIAAITLKTGIIDLKINLPETLYVFLVSVPAIAGIANIMLANNICDIEDDIENKRYTLPIYIGRDRALQLFKLLY